MHLGWRELSKHRGAVLTGILVPAPLGSEDVKEWAGGVARSLPGVPSPVFSVFWGCGEGKLVGAGRMLGWGKPGEAELELSFPRPRWIGFAAVFFLWQKNEICFQASMKTWQHSHWAEGSAHPGGGGCGCPSPTPVQAQGSARWMSILSTCLPLRASCRCASNPRWTQLQDWTDGLAVAQRNQKTTWCSRPSPLLPLLNRLLSPASEGFHPRAFVQSFWDSRFSVLPCIGEEHSRNWKYLI